MPVTLNGKLRDQTGKKPTKQARREGLLPAVVYGQKDNLNIAVNPKELSKIIKQKGQNALIQLALEGDANSNRNVLLKDYQCHPLKEDWTHADFFEVDMKQPIKVYVPVKLTGVSPGVKKGGVLNHVIQQINLECLPNQIPEIIEVSVDKLELEEAIRVSDLEIPGEVDVLNPPTATVAIVHTEKKVEETSTEGEEGSTAPAEGAEEKPSTETSGEGAKTEKK